MAELIEEYENWKGYLPNQNEITIRFQIKSVYCIPELNTRNHTRSYLPFIFNNLEWYLVVHTEYGKMSIELYGENGADEYWSCLINGKFTILNTETHEAEYSEDISEQNITSETVLRILDEYIIHPNYLEYDVVVVELWFNAKSNHPLLLHNKTFLEWYEKFQKVVDGELNLLQEDVNKLEVINNNQQTKIAKLQKKLAYFEEDEQNINIFKEVLRLFKVKRCDKFIHELKLDDTIRVLLQIENNDNLSADEKIEEERRKHNAELADLKHQLEMEKNKYQKLITHLKELVP